MRASAFALLAALAAPTSNFVQAVDVQVAAGPDTAYAPPARLSQPYLSHRGGSPGTRARRRWKRRRAAGRAR